MQTAIVHNMLTLRIIATKMYRTI